MGAGHTVAFRVQYSRNIKPKRAQLFIKFFVAFQTVLTLTLHQPHETRVGNIHAKTQKMKLIIKACLHLTPCEKRQVDLVRTLHRLRHSGYAVMICERKQTEPPCFGNLHHRRRGLGSVRTG